MKMFVLNRYLIPRAALSLIPMVRLTEVRCLPL